MQSLIRENSTSFESFVDNVLSINISVWNSFRPQAAFIFDHFGQLRVDYVARLETLDEDYQAIRGRFKDAPTKLPQLNRSNRPTRTEQSCSDSAKKKVASLYSIDYKLLYSQRS